MNLGSGKSYRHGRMGRGGHRLPKVSHMPVMPDPSTPCGRATPETAVFYPFGHPTPYAYGYRDGSGRRDRKKKGNRKLGREDDRRAATGTHSKRAALRMDTGHRLRTGPYFLGVQGVFEMKEMFCPGGRQAGLGLPTRRALSGRVWRAVVIP
jgi:hypothetical protein